ncbi:MAG: tRNA uridine-5-carboxymethylaminomethyl(34) synthesis GTPase MnmE [Candidatus Eremiobacteraeota bacterium]|nr:tRNA uridine-5-carboxymethylaminomethyl(34) synthesis GTPase MnmE [Candidatus Eremiobacteraeota bacterium]
MRGRRTGTTSRHFPPLTDTIAAIATPPGKGAIAVVRVSGPLVGQLTERLVRAGTKLRPRVAHRATILDEAGEPLDEGLALLFPAPHSYTGETMLELQVHGSPIVAREIVRALLACGARLAEPGEFTQRAFFNGKIDLRGAAAVADVIDAETRSAARAALANLGGGLTATVEAARGTLSEILQEIAAGIDFPDEVPEPQRAEVEARLAPLLATLKELRRDGEIGRIVREGLAVAIVGPPNAGKSSLLNALLGTERAIVSDLPGTTRDTIEERIVVQGVAVRLLDTAGIRSHADRLEAAGIERTERALSGAAIALLVVDGSTPLTSEAARLLERTGGRDRIVYFNKADLGTIGAREYAGADAVVGSVRNGATLDALRAAIARIGWGGERPDASRPHLAALYEFEAVNAAMDALESACRTLRSAQPLDFISTDLQRAFSALGHVSEQVAAEEIVDGIFSRFCIGK